MERYNRLILNILIISQYFWPENFRINQLSIELRKRGHKVTVLTGIPNYPDGKVYSSYLENKDLLLMGGYTHGQDKDLDDAISMWPKLIDFISQSNSEKANFESSKSALLKLYE